MNIYEFSYRLLRKLNLLRLLSDESHIKLSYRAYMGVKLNLDAPKTFNEKLQWLKLNDKNPMYTRMVDKYEAKKYVADRIGDAYIIPTLGVWDHFDEINFDALPEQFVLKCTHDSGGLAICKERAKFDKEKAKAKIEKSLGRNYYLSSREWPYKDVKPRIIAEKFMVDSSAEGSGSQGLTDYKFFCFNGKPEFLYVSRGLEDHATASISFLTLDWQFAPFKRSDYRSFSELPEKPKTFEQMLEMAKKLSEGVAFLRVDFYEIDEKMYFSELTFFPCSGHVPFDPVEWDRKLGDKIQLPQK